MLIIKKDMKKNIIHCTVDPIFNQLSAYKFFHFEDTHEKEYLFPRLFRGEYLTARANVGRIISMTV